MNKDDAHEFLKPNWNVSTECRNYHDTGWVLTLDTGQKVEVMDDGRFHVAGKGWKQINQHLQGKEWPREYATLTAGIKKRLSALDVTQLKYFGEGLSCIESAKAPRAAIVLGWTGFIELLHQRFIHDPEAANAAFTTAFPKLHEKGWSLQTLDDCLKLEDWQKVKVARQMNLYAKHAEAVIVSMNHLRNNCAHVEEFPVTILSALGFYDSLAQFLPGVLIAVAKNET
jgi:hypothetical protein